MLLKIVYLLTCRVLGLAVLVCGGDLAKDAELLVLRHENAVLRRHAGRVRHELADRFWFAALARLVPRRRWTEVFPVTPATLLVAPMRVRPAGWRSCERLLPAVLVEAAGPRRDVKALDLYAAALIVDCVDKRPAQSSIADKLENHWASVAARDTRTLEEAKLNLVHRFGEAARIIAERRYKQADLRARPAYRQLFRIACCEPLYSVRLAAAQEIGAGGDEAFMTLADVLVPPAVGERPRILTRRNRRQPPEELIPGGAVGHHEQEERQHRETVARAWLAPMLVGSVTDCGGPAKENLGRWLAFVQAQERQQWGPGMGLSVEVGLALGFKQAANRRARHPYAQEEARAHLVERAREMLRASEFWVHPAHLDPGPVHMVLAGSARSAQPPTRTRHRLHLARAALGGPPVGRARAPLRSRGSPTGGVGTGNGPARTVPMD